MLELKTVEELPPVRRGGGRTSEERKQIQDALLTGEAQMIENIAVEKEYNALQQRIRQAAQPLNLRVSIRFRKHEDDETVGDVFFRGEPIDTGAEIIDEADVKTKTRSTKTSTAKS